MQRKGGSTCSFEGCSIYFIIPANREKDQVWPALHAVLTFVGVNGVMKKGSKNLLVVCLVVVALMSSSYALPLVSTMHGTESASRSFQEEERPASTRKPLPIPRDLPDLPPVDDLVLGPDLVDEPVVDEPTMNEPVIDQPEVLPPEKEPVALPPEVEPTTSAPQTPTIQIA